MNGASTGRGEKRRQIDGNGAKMAGAARVGKWVGNREREEKKRKARKALITSEKKEKEKRKHEKNQKETSKGKKMKVKETCCKYVILGYLLFSVAKK